MRIESMPHCHIMHCPSIPALHNGNARVHPDGPLVHGSACSFSCHSEYFLTGPRTKNCNAGKWYPSGKPTCNPKPCHHSPCGIHGVCHNDGNYNYRCECRPVWQGRHCNYRKISLNNLSNLKRDILDSLGKNGGTSNDNYRNILYNFLSKKYSYYYWVVDSYSPVWGFGAHTVGGWRIEYFRTHGRNLVVAWARKSSTELPRDTNATQAKFSSRLRYTGCDPRGIYDRANKIAKI